VVHGGLSALSEIAVAYKEIIKDPATLEDHLRNVSGRLLYLFLYLVKGYTTGIQAFKACPRKHINHHS